MGIINHDSIQTDSGITITDTYISFHYETIFTKKIDPNNYQIFTNYKIFLNLEAKDTGKAPIAQYPISTNITKEQLDANIFSYLYDALKVIYPNSTDEISPITGEIVREIPPTQILDPNIIQPNA